MGAMGMTNRAFITGSVLQWARERARIKLDEVARRMKEPEESVLLWEHGKDAPTFRQAERLADLLRIPFGYLFLPAPPLEKLPLPDFRTVRGAEPALSADLIDVVNDVLVKQEWYRDFLLEEGTPKLAFVGRFSIRDHATQVAADVRETLKINTALRQGCQTPEEFLRTIVRNAEARGIVVMRSGVVAGNPRRPLSVKDFRGFAISDPVAPVVFINGRDWPKAKLFTLAHELAHIWIAESGISNLNLREPTTIGYSTIERFCNQTAAEILIPEIELQDVWTKDRSLESNIDTVSIAFKVSVMVVILRAFDAHLITRRQYQEYYERESERYEATAKIRKKGGGHFERNVVARNGETVTSAAVFGAIEGKVLYRDAARLLNVGVPQIQKIADFMTRGKEGAGN